MLKIQIIFFPQSDLCTGLTCVLVCCLYWSVVCTLRRFYQSNICTSRRFVLVRRLYWSVVRTGLLFVLVCRSYWSVVCTVRRFYQSNVCTSRRFVLVRRLYCPRFLSLRFVPSDVCGSEVCTGTGIRGQGGRRTQRMSIRAEYI